MVEKINNCPFRIHKRKNKYAEYEAEYFMPCMGKECPAFYTTWKIVEESGEKITVEKCKRLD